MADPTTQHEHVASGSTYSMDNAESVSPQNDKETETADLDDTLDDRLVRTQKLIRRTRLIKLFNTVLFLSSVIAILCLAATSENTTGYQLVAYVIAILYLMGAVYFLSILFGSNELHYIYVKRKHIHGFTNFVIPKCTVEENTRTIKSVSAVTATFGSNAHGLFTRSAYASVGGAFSAIIIHWNDRTDELQTKEKIASILMLCGIFGNALYGTWELEGPSNYLSSFMHYSCAPLIFVLQTLAYCIQSQWSVLSVVLFSVGIVVDIIYVVIIYALPEHSDDVKTVHRVSLICIVCEFVALAIPCFSVVLFLWNL